MNVLAQKSSITPPPPPSDIGSPYGFIRGGRLRKTSKGLISFAPFLAGASVLALGAILATTLPVQAGSCTEEPDMSGMWTCTGAANSSSDMRVSIMGRADQDVNITGDATFDLSVSNNGGFYVNTVSTTGAIGLDLSNSNVTAHYEAIGITQLGTGAITITASGTISTTANYSAISIVQAGAGGTTVTTSGTVSSVGAGIFINSSSGTMGEIRVTANNVMTDGNSFDISSNGDSPITIMTSGTVTSNTEQAIVINHSGTGDVNITSRGTVTANAAAKDAINVYQSGSGNITLTVNGSVVGGSSANAIDLSTASGDATIILGTSASFTRDIDVSGVMGNASLEIGGTGNRSFDIGNIPAITGGINFNKNGSHTLTVTGTHASGAVFEQTNINEGRLVWNSRNPLRSTSITLAHGASLEVMRVTSWSSNLTLSGRLAITGANSGLELGTLTGSGGQIDIDVDFSGGDADLDSPKLLLSSVDGDSIAVNIRSLGEFPEISEDGEAITLGNIIQVTGNADADAFVAGRALNRGFRFQLVHDDSSGMNRWAVVATEAGGIEEGLYESLPAALTQLANLESRQQRLRGRQHAINQAMWARIAGASGEFEPISTIQATYETENAVAEFGIEAPIHTNDSSFTLGASVAFGDATTDVSVLDSVGEIASKSIISTVNAGWERKGIYVDGQLRYTSFDNRVETDAKIADVDAESYNAGIEAGYTMELGKLIGIRPDALLIPSAQISWTNVDFDNFTDANGTNVTLEDGDVLLARAGVAFEDTWKGVALRGHADVLVPLDGEVVTKLDGTETISEREDPAFDIGIGATYSWGGAYALSADISTQQGGDVAGYAASLGFVYSFF